VRGAKSMNLLTGLRAGDPAAFPRGGGDATVERGGQLERDAQRQSSRSSDRPSALRNWAKSSVWRKSR
jgi:hypothetical protein